MQQPAERHRERMAGVSERVLPLLEEMNPLAVARCAARMVVETHSMIAFYRARAWLN